MSEPTPHFEGPRDRSLRVGDGERDAVGEILRQRHLEGRLDGDEFQARLERSMAAKTYADLDALLADLPREAADRRPDDRGAGRRLGRAPFAFRVLFVPLAVIAAIFVIGHHFWVAVPFILLFVAGRRVWRGPRGRYGRGRWGAVGRGRAWHA